MHQGSGNVFAGLQSLTYAQASNIKITEAVRIVAKYPKCRFQVKSEATRISSLSLVCYGHFVKFVFHRPQKI